jgi:hypothetical protein
LQISQIQRASVLPPAREHPITDPVTVAPQGLALVELVAER